PSSFSQEEADMSRVDRLGWLGAALAMTFAVGGAARAPLDSTPKRYDCPDRAVFRPDGTLVVGGSTTTPVHTDGPGAHYVFLGRSEVTEYVVPSDPRADIDVRTYDAGRRDGPVRQRGICIPRGGYTDALLRFMRGATPDEVAAELALDRDDV